MLDDIAKQAEQKMQKSLESLSKALTKIRTGRAHPDLLNGIVIDYYGNPTPLNQVASIMVSDPQTITVTPFEKSTVTAIDKAIRTSDLGLNPVTAGQAIRVPLPALTEERRRDLTKKVKGEAENSRIAIRNIRRDAKQHIKDLLKNKEISEDEEKGGEDKLQKLTDLYVGKVEGIIATKETDLMQI